MFKRHLWPAIQWIYGSILQIWYYLARPFRRRSDSTELPLASPVVPSTPSFIQSQEPNFTIDAMRIFQLNNAATQASHLARNQLAIQQMRTAPPHISRIASLSSTDPSPGFSLLADVVDNLETSAEGNSPSLYSSPPSSPSSSLHTPCIVVSSHMGDTALRKSARPSLEFTPQREPRISGWDSISQGEFPLPRHDSPEVYGLAKRRNFQGAPIMTNLSRDFLPFPPPRISQANVTLTDWRTQQNLSRPKSALAAVTDFVRAIPPRNISRETLVISPESQAAFTQRSPFSAQAESFFMDEHLNYPPEFDIHDFGIYADAGSTLNLQVPRRKRTVVSSQPLHSSFCRTTNNYGKPNFTKEFGRECRRTSCSSIVTDTPYKRTRTLSGVSDMTKMDISSATTPGGSLSPVFLVPSSVPSHMLVAQESSSPGLSIQEYGSDSTAQHIPLVVEPDEELRVSSSLSLYASLIFPFSLEDSVSWDTGPDFQHHEVDFADLDCNALHSFDRDDPVLGAMALGDNVIDIDGVLGCDSPQLSVSTSTQSTSDHQPGDLPPLVMVVEIGDDIVQGDNVVSLKECSFCFPTAVDESFVAGSTTSSALGTHTDSLRNSGGPCEEGSNAACDLPEVSLRRVDGGLDAPFVSPGDSSVLPPVSGSKSCVNEPQTFSSAMSASPIDFSVAQDISDRVNSRRARRVGIYGPIFPPVVTLDAQDDLLLNSEICLFPSASERRRSSSRRESRHGSVLRPLVLPMRVAIRELRTPAGDRSFERALDTSLQSNRTSIGFPPSFPLPELPLYTSSSNSTIVASGFSTFEELDAFQKLESISARSLTPPNPLSTHSAAKLEETCPDPDGGDSMHTVNWGVAF